MVSQPPAHWTFAARAAYFGDRVCAFCHHRNPAGARFCNDCASPLHLKPCNQCGAVNDQAATNCYMCGAACPASFATPEATAALAAAQPAPASLTPGGDISVAATATQPLSATSRLQAYWRLVRPGQFLLAAIATILIAAAYAVYRIHAVTLEATEVASQPIVADEHGAPAATPSVPATIEPKPPEPETTAALQAPILATDPEAPKQASAPQRPAPAPGTKRASTPQRTAPVPAPKRASAHQRPVPARHPPVSATPPAAHGLAAARIGARIAKARKALRPRRWQLMHVSMARCSGGLIARIACGHRVRRRFCEGHWGEVPECTNGVANDHGQ